MLEAWLQSGRLSCRAAFLSADLQAHRLHQERQLVLRPALARLDQEGQVETPHRATCKSGRQQESISDEPEQASSDSTPEAEPRYRFHLKGNDLSS
jgi:hypothetical protein